MPDLLTPVAISVITSLIMTLFAFYLSTEKYKSVNSLKSFEIEKDLEMIKKNVETHVSKNESEDKNQSEQILILSKQVELISKELDKHTSSYREDYKAITAVIKDFSVSIERLNTVLEHIKETLKK